MGVEAASPTNTENGRTGKLKTKDEDRLKYASTKGHKCASEWPRMNLILGL